jgi:hypothetical protein
MTDTDPLQALDQRIDAWLRHVYDPQTKPLEPDEPIDPRCVALHADLRALEQRCTLERWPPLCATAYACCGIACAASAWSRIPIR